MSKEAGFTDDYFSTYYGANDYFNNQAIIENFRNIAREIKKRLNPRTVLDVGCACGHFVKALREVGIEAWGLDASKSAIEHAHPSIGRFVALSLLPELKIPAAFPKSYDLVANIEVMEHLRREDASAGVRRLTELSQRVLFSSTPRDWDESTHVGIRQPAEWCSLFRECCYAPALDQMPNYVSAQAFLFLKESPSDAELWQRAVNTLVSDKNHYDVEHQSLIKLAHERLGIIHNQQAALEAKDAVIAGNRASLEEKDQLIARLQVALEGKDRLAERQQAALEAKDGEIAGNQTSLEEKSRTIVDLKSSLERKDRLAERQQAALETKDAVIVGHIASLEEKKRSIVALQSALEAKDKALLQFSERLDVLSGDDVKMQDAVLTVRKICEQNGTTLQSLKADRTELEKVGRIMADLYQQNKDDRSAYEVRNEALARELDCQQRLCALQECALREQAEKLAAKERALSETMEKLVANERDLQAAAVTQQELCRILNSRSYRLALRAERLYHLFHK